MKAVNEHNMKRLKRALQKQKLKRIDAYRMQVCSIDILHPYRPQMADVPFIVKDHQGQFMIV